MSSWHTGQLTFALGLGGIMSFYGIVAFIVAMMPEGSVAKDQKIVIIVLILLTLPFTLLVGFLAARRSKKRAAKEAELQAGTQANETNQQAPAAKAAPVGTYTQVSEGAEEAVQFLKSSNLGVGGKDAVHSLPWYVVAGAPKTGKSSLVLASNLNFQNLPSQRQSEMKFIRPTGSVDWRVTSDALFIDTAGRYQTEGVDGEEWASLLETIKKYRSNRPIDGFILVVDASTILRSDDRQNEELAKTLRTRLDDAMQRLKVRFPVYLVFTNADSIEGLRDSFSSSKNENTALVWGATIPIEKSENAQALFDSEYELLHNSLMKRRLVRLSAPFPPVRQLRIFNFPLHFGSARRKFGSFVNALFRPNPFSENPFLRGFYFTAAPASKTSPQGVQTVGTSFFTERFFRDVLLRDKDLVRTMVAQRQRPPILGWAVTTLGALFVIAFLTMAAVSLASNKQMLTEATRAGETALVLRRADANKDVLAKNPDEVRDEVRVMDEMKTFMTRLDNYERDGAPLHMRFGLYSGNTIYRNNLLPLYFNIIERRFKAPTVKRVEAELQKFASGESTVNSSQLDQEEEQRLDRYYNLLKAYLMLSDGSQVIDGNTVLYREKAEATHIVNTLKEFWLAESKVPNDMKAASEQHLEFWAKQIDRYGDASGFPRIALNEKLVEDSRRKLQAFPAVNRYYSNQVTRISKEIDDKIGPSTVEAILARNGADASYLTGSHRVPSAFTRPGVELMKTAFEEADERLSEDDWVMGEIGKRELNLAQATDQVKLEDFYYRDYADHWRRFVTGVQLRPYKSRSDASDALQVLSSANSPIKILLIDIERNTNLSAKVDSGSWWDTIMSFFTRTETDVVGNTQPEKDFRPLTTFVGKPDDDKAPILNYQAQLGQVYSRFSTVTDDSMRRVIEQMGNEQDPLDINKREQAIVGMLSGFSETPSGQELSKLLQQPIGNLKTLLGAGIKQQLQKVWVEEMLPAAAEIETGYPFQDGQTEADLAKLTAFLNPNDGRLTKFYKDRLEKYFEESGGSLKPVETTEVQFTDEFVAYLNHAFALRTALFGTNPTPKFEYDFNLRPTKEAIVEITIDGQKVSSSGTGSNRLSFPAAQSAETGVLVTLLSTGTPSADGTTSPPASPASSNPFQGTWGLFRFVDASSPKKQAGGEYLLSFSAGGTSVGATIRSSGGDIFDRTIFRQVRAPKAFMK